MPVQINSSFYMGNALLFKHTQNQGYMVNITQLPIANTSVDTYMTIIIGLLFRHTKFKAKHVIYTLAMANTSVDKHNQLHDSCSAIPMYRAA